MAATVDQATVTVTAIPGPILHVTHRSDPNEYPRVLDFFPEVVRIHRAHIIDPIGRKWDRIWHHLLGHVVLADLERAAEVEVEITEPRVREREGVVRVVPCAAVLVGEEEVWRGAGEHGGGASGGETGSGYSEGA